MYYYITEPARSREDQQAEERIRELLIRHSIAGEFVTTSPTRGVEELAEMGVAKKYTTLVAVGSEPFLNQLGTLLAGTPYVFGAIPVRRPDALASVNGIRTHEEAVEALKFRRVRAVPICRIEPNKFFLSELRMTATSDVGARIRIDDALIECTCREIVLTGSGTMDVQHVRQPAASGNVFRQLFGQRPKEVVETSHFHGHVLAIETNQPQPFYLGSELFARTPLAATTIPSSLKMITRRDTVSALSDVTPEAAEAVSQTNNW